jgi:beta-lactam-binding protein with PASTA domain
MTPRYRLLAASVPLTLALSGALGACGGAPSTPQSVSQSTTTPTTATTVTTAAAAAASSAASTTTAATAPEVAVPDVIGLKLEAARFFMYEAGFFTVPLTTPCDKGTPTSQSVVASLSILREPPDLNLGAVPLVAGTSLPKGSWVGITWSGCYPNGSVVPEITGLSFNAAVGLLHTAGLTWACYSMATLTASLAGTSAPTTTTLPHKSSATTTTTVPPTVLSQGTAAGTVLDAGTPVVFVMHRCPQ